MPSSASRRSTSPISPTVLPQYWSLEAGGPPSASRALVSGAMKASTIRHHHSARSRPGTRLTDRSGRTSPSSSPSALTVTRAPSKDGRSSPRWYSGIVAHNASQEARKETRVIPARWCVKPPSRCHPCTLRRSHCPAGSQKSSHAMRWSQAPAPGRVNDLVNRVRPRTSSDVMEFIAAHPPMRTGHVVGEYRFSDLRRLIGRCAPNTHHVTSWTPQNTGSRWKSGAVLATVTE